MAITITTALAAIGTASFFVVAGKSRGNKKDTVDSAIKLLKNKKRLPEQP